VSLSAIEILRARPFYSAERKGGALLPRTRTSASYNYPDYPIVEVRRADPRFPGPNIKLRTPTLCGFSKGGRIPLISAKPQCAEMCELKKRKKLEPTSIALQAASASSIALEEVMPLLPSAAGQSLWSMISTGRTSHQIGVVFTRLLSTTWSWFGVGTKIGMVGGPVFPSTFSVTDKSTEEACMVQVPGTAWFGSGH
jgi:hypothetical protein